MGENYPECSFCGGEMSKNPHPDAGKPTTLLEVGCKYECIPCLVKNRHRWAERAMKAETSLLEIERQNEGIDNRMQYVVGFLFNSWGEVLLIEKNRPDWQKGKLNGVGGHVEKGETPHEAMRREFKGEASADIASWKHYCTVYYTDAIVHYFKAFDNVNVYAATDEQIVWKPVINIPNNVVFGLYWLIPMALYHDETMLQVKWIH